MSYAGSVVRLDRAWRIGDRIGAGGFGQVYEASSDGVAAVAKFVPKARGADRELLFVDLGSACNVVPVIDSGETDEAWVLVMPRADRSLRERLDAEGTPDLAGALVILEDIAVALESLGPLVVHRDLKPENVLYLDGHWRLADFGISRYAEATTAADTQKFSLTPAYAGPERFRGERATASTDVYSFGVLAYEVLGGARPFPGPRLEDYREQHLTMDPPPLTTVPGRLGALVIECLYKSPESRPTAANLLVRLRKIATSAVTGGLARLQDVHVAEVQRRSEAARQASIARSERERRDELARDAARAYAAICAEVRESIVDAAPTVSVEGGEGRDWTLLLGDGMLRMTRVFESPTSWTVMRQPAPIDVVAHASVVVMTSAGQTRYPGRAHSLWYCNAMEPDRYQWYELAFTARTASYGENAPNPLALDPGSDNAARALWRGMADFQVAWPVTPLDPGDLDEFVDRWADWFAHAALGTLRRPNRMPEMTIPYNWRR